jgi:hypothetical protein
MAWLELPMKVAASSDIAWARSMHPLNPGLPNGTSYSIFDGMLRVGAGTCRIETS